MPISYIHEIRENDTFLLYPPMREGLTIRPVRESVLEYGGKDLLVVRHHNQNTNPVQNWKWELVIGFVNGTYKGGEPTHNGLKTTAIDLIPEEMYAEITDFVKENIQDFGNYVSIKRS